MPERAEASSLQHPESAAPNARARRAARIAGAILLAALALWMLRSYLTTLCWAHHNAHHRGLLLIKGRAGIDLTFEQVDNTPAWVKRKFGLLEEAA